VVVGLVVVLEVLAVVSVATSPPSSSAVSTATSTAAIATATTAPPIASQVFAVNRPNTLVLTCEVHPVAATKHRLGAPDQRPRSRVARARGRSSDPGLDAHEHLRVVAWARHGGHVTDPPAQTPHAELTSAASSRMTA
jgi:hypothetical protein